MRNQDVIQFLKSEPAVPPRDAAEHCIASLPEVKPKKGILPLLRLQFSCLPAGMYALALLILMFQLRLMWVLEPGDSLMVSGVASALIVLLLGWHLTLSGTEGMTDMERCCKYSYGQILLSRVLCLSALSLAALLAAAIPGAFHHRAGLTYVLAAMLPTAIGALAAVVWANFRGNGDLSLMTVYLVASLLASQSAEALLESGPVLAAVLLLIVGAALCSQTKSLMNRRIEYATYPY